MAAGRPSHPVPLIRRSVMIEEPQDEWLVEKYGSISAGIRACIELARIAEDRLCGGAIKSRKILDPAEAAG